MATCRCCGTKKIEEFVKIPDPASNQTIPFSLCAGCGSIQHDLPTYRDTSLEGADVYGPLGEQYSMFCIELGQRVFRDMPLIRYMKPGTAFNLECNDGHFASQWISRGWTVFGSTLSEISHQRGIRRGYGGIRGRASQFPERPLDAFFTETSYCVFNNPFAEIDWGMRGLRPGGVVLIHGPDPTSQELMDEGVVGEFVSYYSRTVPSPRRIIEWMRDRNLALVERYHLGPSMDLLFVKTS